MIGDWSAAAVLPAGCAAVAVGLWVSSPAGQLRRAREPARHDLSARLRAPLAARPDAAPLRQRLLVSTAGAFAVCVFLRSLGGAFDWLVWMALPLLIGASVVALGRLEPARSRARHQRLVLDLPQALELMSACLAAGMPRRRATAAVAAAYHDGPVSEDLGKVLTLVELGRSDADAWRGLREHPLWGGAALDLARSVENGTMMVDVLLHHAQAARARRRAALEVRAKSAGVRSVLPLMACFLPAFLLLGVIPTVASALANALF